MNYKKLFVAILAAELIAYFADDLRGAISKAIAKKIHKNKIEKRTRNPAGFVADADGQVEAKLDRIGF